MRLPKLTLLTFAVYLAAPTGTAMAVACPGAPAFTDVSASAIYCTDTEWLKNRAVTLGCVGTNFCPNDVVTRGSMALFMQRLGTALSPQTIKVDTAPGAIDLDGAASILPCQTGDFAVTGYPRKAFINSIFAGLADGALSYRHEVNVSTDGGVTWHLTNSNINRNGTSGVHWVSSNTNFIQDLAVGTTYRWATRLARANGTGDFSDSRCFINVEILNRTGGSSPFDQDTIQSADH